MARKEPRRGRRGSVVSHGPTGATLSSRPSGTPPWPPRAATCTPHPPTGQPGILGCEGRRCLGPAAEEQPRPTSGSPPKQKARLGAGPSVLLTERLVLVGAEEAAKLPVQASPDHGKLVAIATVVEVEAELIGGHGSTVVRHAYHVASEEAVVLPVVLEIDVQAFDLQGQVVGEGILDAAAHRPTPVVVITIVEEAEACVGRRNEAAGSGRSISHIEPRADERRAVRDAGAEAEAAEVVAIVTVRERGTASGVDQQAVNSIAKTAPHRAEPLDAPSVEAVEAVEGSIEQRHVAQRAVANPGRGRDAEARSERNGCRREDAGSGPEATEAEDVVVTTAEVGVLGIGFDTNHEARARRELVVVADLTAAHEAVAVTIVVEASKAEVVKPGQRHHWRKPASCRRHREAAAAKAAEAKAVVEQIVIITIREAITRVHAEVEAGPGEHRSRHERNRSRSHNRAARQVG